jgi:hypothetical protein
MDHPAADQPPTCLLNFAGNIDHPASSGVAVLTIRLAGMGLRTNTRGLIFEVDIIGYWPCR